MFVKGEAKAYLVESYIDSVYTFLVLRHDIQCDITHVFVLLCRVLQNMWSALALWLLSSWKPSEALRLKKTALIPTF